MENLIVSINCVTPIFINLLVGYYAKRSKIVPDEVYGHMSRICFSVLLPLMMFDNVYSADFKGSFSKELIFFLLAETLAVFIVGYIILFKAEKNHRLRGAYIQTLYRSNIAVIGIALAQVLMNADGVALMTIAITVLVPLFNALAVITLETCRGEKVALGKTLINIVKSPLILGALIGIAFVLLGIRLPSAVQGAISRIGKAGSVMTLIALGASFNFSGLKKNALRLTGCTLVRLVFVPACVMLSAVLLGFTNNALATVMICTASPLATTSFPMAQVYDSDYELTGQIIVTTSLLCCFTMFVWIFLLKQLALI